jgi:hypothetical protein
VFLVVALWWATRGKNVPGAGLVNWYSRLGLSAFALIGIGVRIRLFNGDRSSQQSSITLRSQLLALRKIVKIPQDCLTSGSGAEHDGG